MPHSYMKQLESIVYAAKTLINNEILGSYKNDKGESILISPLFRNLIQAISITTPMEEYRIVISGSRKWTNYQRIFDVLSSIPQRNTHNITIIHGDCYGADKISGDVARELGYKVIEMPAEWHRYGKAAGPIRNRKLFIFNPHEVIAFHNNIDSSKGTIDTVTEAIKRSIKTILYTEQSSKLLG